MQTVPASSSKPRPRQLTLPDGTDYNPGEGPWPIFALPFSMEEPPFEVCIFPSGPFDTRKGPYLFDAEAAQAVMAEYGKHATELHWDYEHQSLVNPPIEAPAACWFVPQIRDGALWATQIRWTPRADAYLRNKEYRYFSPAFDTDPETGRVLRLINVALTNLPATKGLNPLVAASEKEIPTMAKFLVKHSAKPVAKARLSALKTALADAELKMADDGDYDADAMIARVAKMLAVPLSDDTELKTLAADDEDGDCMKALTALGAQLKRLGAVAASESLKSPTSPASVADKQLLTRLKDFERDVLALTEKDDPAAARGVLVAMKQAQAQVVELSERVATMERTGRQEKFDVMLAEGKRIGKITPAFATSKFFAQMRERDSSLVELRTYLDEAPAISAVTSPEIPQLEKAPDSVMLTQADRDVMKLTHLTEKEVLEHKKKRLERRA